MPEKRKFVKIFADEKADSDFGYGVTLYIHCL